MIRVRLTSDDIDRITIAASPDYGFELALGGGLLAGRTRSRRFSRWRQEVTRSWKPDMSRIFDLYTEDLLPVFDLSTHPDGDERGTPPAGGAWTPHAAAYLEDLARARALTPFTRALASGRASAYADLKGNITDFRAMALDPYRRQVASAVVNAGAQAQARARAFGMQAVLRTLHPLIDWDGSFLALHTAHHCTLSLAGRSLVLRPAAFATGITYDAGHDRVTVVYPATQSAIVRDRRLDAPSPALTALLGSTRAAALSAIARTPATTTSQLGAALGLSAAAASRHATVLREGGLITTFRNGQFVHHSATRLGQELVTGPDAG